jgi:hypothetical protein
MLRRAFVSLVVSLSLAACTGAQPVTMRVTAASGGTVTASTHVVAIPPLALASDTDVTLEVVSASGYPALEGGRDEVLRIQPEGTVLEIPAVVTIRADFVDAPASSTVSVFQLVAIDGPATWRPLEGARDPATGDVTVSVTVFAPLGLVVRDAASTGEIRGTISWGDGSPAAGAPLQLMSGTTVVATVTADTNGTFAFTGVAPGEYRVVVDYECRIDQPVTVTAGSVSPLTLVVCPIMS